MCGWTCDEHGYRDVIGDGRHRPFNSFVAAVAMTLPGWAAAPQGAVAAGLPDEFDEPPTEQLSVEHPLSAGEVVAVDRASATITVRCRPISELFVMEAMTMVLRVSDGSMLDGLTSGDRIRFKVERAGTGLRVVRLDHSN